MNKKIFAINLSIMLSLIVCLLPPAFAGDYSNGVAAYSKKNFKKALGLFKKSLIDNTNQANSRYYIALCYHQLGYIDQAKESYLLVIKKYPKTTLAKQAFKILAKLDPAIARLAGAHSQSAPLEDYSGLPEKTTVKYGNYRGSGHIILPVKINGIQASMMFDTGAGVTVAKQSYLDSKGITVKNTRQSGRLRGVGGEVAAKVGLVNITVGRMTRSIPLMIEQDNPSAGSRLGYLSRLPLLGQNYFKDLTYEIDDGHKFITFRKAKGKTNKSSGYNPNEVPFYRQGNHIIVKPKVNGRECEMILDTGAGTVAFADRHLAMCGLNRPTSARSGQSRGVGGAREGFNFYVKKMSLGPIKRENVRCSMILHSRFNKPLLGQTFLKGLCYTIDPSRNVIIFR